MKIKNNNNNSKPNNLRKIYKPYSLTKDKIKQWTSDFIKNNNNILIQNIVSLNSLEFITINRNIHQSDEQFFPRRVLPLIKVNNQYFTGNCWIFAGLNTLRPHIAKKYNLKEDFEFSTAYLYLYDRIEVILSYFNKLNYNLDLLNKCNNKEKQLIINNNIIDIVKTGIVDGGCYQRFTFLVDKYGLLPKSVFKDSLHTLDSEELNKVLTHICSSYSIAMINNESVDIEKILEETYSIIVKFIGTPPENFNWEYYDNNEPVSKYHIYDNLTPLSFYKMLKINVNDFVSISNNPNYQYNIPIVEFDGREKYDNSDDNSICIQQKTLNLDILRSIELIIRSINDNIPVWIGCSIGDNFNLNLSILDKNASRYENILDINNHHISKKDKLKWLNNSLHAIVIVAYKMLDDNIIFQCINSWGEELTGDGYLQLSASWLNDNLTDFAIHKKFLTKKEINNYNN